jgi:Wadjet protein JetD, C-terminal
VADVDTKWVWPRRGIVRDLMRQLLDDDGFAILARARRTFPNTVSVLMDEDTLLAHRKLWV